MQLRADYATAIARKYPEQVAIAIVKDAQGKYNPITLGWVMPTSHKPPMLAISVAFVRYSYEAIRQSKTFVVSFPSDSMADAALFYGTNSGRDVDKIAAFGSKTESAAAIDGLLFSDAVANFECVLKSETATGDHAIFVGEVVAAHINDDDTLQRLYTLGMGYRMGGVRAARP